VFFSYPFSLGCFLFFPYQHGYSPSLQLKISREPLTLFLSDGNATKFSLVFSTRRLPPPPSARFGIPENDDTSDFSLLLFPQERRRGRLFPPFPFPRAASRNPASARLAPLFPLLLITHKFFSSRCAAFKTRAFSSLLFFS